MTDENDSNPPPPGDPTKWAFGGRPGWPGLYEQQVGRQDTGPTKTPKMRAEEIDALLVARSAEVRELRDELVRAYKRLCRYEGHLTITDPDGREWCERCHDEIK